MIGTEDLAEQTQGCLTVVLCVEEGERRREGGRKREKEGGRKREEGGKEREARGGRRRGEEERVEVHLFTHVEETCDV